MVDALQSDELTDFYLDYLGWLNRGAPNRQPYSRDRGLCDALNKFCEENCIDSLLYEMRAQFEKTGNGTLFPFGGSLTYFYEEESNTAYKNPARIKWVQDHAPV